MLAHSSTQSALLWQPFLRFCWNAVLEWNCSMSFCGTTDAGGQGDWGAWKLLLAESLGGP